MKNRVMSSTMIGISGFLILVLAQTVGANGWQVDLNQCLKLADSRVLNGVQMQILDSCRDYCADVRKVEFPTDVQRHELAICDLIDDKIGL